MSTSHAAGVVMRTEPLGEEYLSPSFVAREGHLLQLLEDFSPLHGAARPVGLWLHGPPGSGKTATVKRVLSVLEERGVRTAYVNCWTAQTFCAVLEAAFQELRAVVGEQRDLSYKFERLWRLATEHPLVLVLDEIDQMLPRERNATLYNLCRLQRAGLVCLSTSREVYLALDPRVQSRLPPRFLAFQPYDQVELISILEERAGQALAPEAWCRADLERIAQASGGDARAAIQTLRVAAYLAEKGRVPQIRLGDLEEGARQASQLRRRYLLKGLGEHHRLLYQIIQESPGISTKNLWRRYLLRARVIKLQPVPVRTFRHYRRYLVSSRLLEERQARGRNNRRVMRVVA